MKTPGALVVEHAGLHLRLPLQGLGGVEALLLHHGLLHEPVP